MTTALFVPEASGFVATDLARGPWSPNALHGAPVSALLASVVESVDAGDNDMHVARLTVELERMGRYADQSHVGPEGVAFAESELFDTGGRFGRSVQSLLVEGP